MRTWARWTARTALFTASLATAGITTAGLASAGVTSGNHSVGGGNQVSVPVRVPVSVCGNAIAVLGGALAGCEGGASVSGGSGSGGSMTSGNYSILGGNQVSVPVRVPVDICGNAVGNAKAGCMGGASVGTTDYSYGPATTSGNHSIGGGNQVSVPVRVPVDICGNAAAVLGGALAGCQGGASVGAPAHASGMTPATLLHSLAARHMVRQSSIQAPLSGALAGLTKLQGLAGLSKLTSVSRLASASSAQSIPAHLLSAEVSTHANTASAPGMGSGSLLALAAGALAAGAAALVAAGRRITAHRATR